MIDNYVRVDPERGSAEDVWNRVARLECVSLYSYWCHHSPCSVAAEKALTVLTSLLTSGVVQSQTQLRARVSFYTPFSSIFIIIVAWLQCLYGMGRAQLLMAWQANPDSPSEWRQGEGGEGGASGVPQMVDSGGEGGVMGGVTNSMGDNLPQEEEGETSKERVSCHLLHVACVSCLPLVSPGSGF